jgi:hypothetical protein
LRPEGLTSSLATNNRESLGWLSITSQSAYSRAVAWPPS